MAICDLDKLSNTELILQFILEKNGKGLCLPYTDYSLIEQWLNLSEQDVKRLLLILDDVIPDKKSHSRPYPLKVFDKKVQERLKNAR